MTAVLAAASTLAVKTQELMLLAAAPCAQAPPGMQQYADQLTGWAKWAVLSLLGIGFFSSIVMLIWGRVTQHPRGARLGFDGIMICLGAAILFVVGYLVITSITGTGC